MKEDKSKSIKIRTSKGIVCASVVLRYKSGIEYIRCLAGDKLYNLPARDVVQD